MSARPPVHHVQQEISDSYEIPAETPAAFLLVDAPARDAGAPPQEVVLLAGCIAGEDSAAARRIQLKRREDGRVLASALVTPAEESVLFSRLGVDRKVLSKCSAITDVSLDGASGEFLSPLLYFCARRARIEERPSILSALAGPDTTHLGTVRLEPLPRLRPLASGRQMFAPVAQRLDLVIHNAFESSSHELRELLRDHFVPEVVEVLDRWTERFFETPFFRAIYDGTLTREQYVYTLSQMYQFVKWTTRLIGLAVRHSHDKVVRRKWLEHLHEEVDHEVIIERDLAALGVDVRYVIDSMVPNVPNQQFMVAQESMIGFHEDPVRFMASPLPAEGFAARLDQRFVDALRRAVSSWGVANPKQCTAFWASHLEFDGGDDGHYEHTRRVLRYCLKTDTDLANFLVAMRMAMQAQEKSYTSYIEELGIFSARPDGTKSG